MHLKNVVWNTAAVLSRPQYVKLDWLSTISYNFIGQMTSSKAVDKIARNHVFLRLLIKTAAWFSYPTGLLFPEYVTSVGCIINWTVCRIGWQFFEKNPHMYFFIAY